MKVAKSPDDNAARTNLVFLSAIEVPTTTKYILFNDQFAFSCRFSRYFLMTRVDNSIQVGSVGTTLFQRRFANLSLGQDVKIKAYDPIREGEGYLATLTLMVRI